MPRGSDAKLRRRNRKKDEDQAVTEMFADQDGDNEGDAAGGFTEELPLPPGLSNKAVVEEDDSDKEEAEEAEADPMPKKKKKKSKAGYPTPVPKAEKGIKTLPLMLLILMTGTTLMPALIYASDYIGGFMAKNDILGGIGFRLGIGQVPKKRVLSFYEKHAPDKLNDVPQILSKYYGDYPKLIKKLERKYHDYGYFLGWEEDEAPMKLMSEYLSDLYGMWIKQWNQFAPQVLKTAARNARYNLTSVYKTARKAWIKNIWPVLEPIFGVPEGAEKQKRADAQQARQRKSGSGGGTSKRRKNREYRDSPDE